MPEFTDEQVSKARHALGLDGRHKTAYRNYYSSDGLDPAWETLVEHGLATSYKSATSPDTVYHLTREAAAFVLKPGEQLDPELKLAKPPTPAHAPEEEPPAETAAACCENCRWWTDSVTLEHVEESGQCFFKPPKIDRRTGRGIWPFTLAGEICGSHQPDDR